MKTQKEIEKGCGENWNWGGEEVICGIKDGDNNYLCPICQALLQQNKEFVEMIDKLIKIKTEERVLWEYNLLRSGKSIHQKGYFKNPDFQIQANTMIYVLEEIKSMIYVLEELKSSIIGSEEK